MRISSKSKKVVPVKRRLRNAATKPYALSNSLVSIPRLPRNIWKNQVFPVVTNVYRGGVISSSTASVFTAYSFALADCNDVTTYTNAFDQYMIYKIDCRIIIQNQAPLPGTTVLSNCPNLISVIDYDDDSVLASYNAGLSYHSAMIHAPGTNIVRSFRPKVNIGVVNSTGNVVAGGAGDSMWINTNANSVKHYALKTVWEQSTSASTLTTYNLYVKYHLLFRCSR